jgi:hypothetical protein
MTGGVAAAALLRNATAAIINVVRIIRQFMSFCRCPFPLFSGPTMIADGTLHPLEVFGVGAPFEWKEDQVMWRCRLDYDRRKEFRKWSFVHFDENLDIRQVKLNIVDPFDFSRPRRQYALWVWVISLVGTNKLVIIAALNGSVGDEGFYRVCM